MGKLKSRCCHAAFTLVELLVVIGIIALLITILIPTLTAARRSADRVKCGANLKQIGNAFRLYELENHGFWPMTLHQWKLPTDTANREKRWQHYLSKYLVNEYLNDDGTDVRAESRIKDKNNALWGCPVWNRLNVTTIGSVTIIGVNVDYNNGYAMNYYPFAPDPLPTSYVGVNAPVTVRNLPPSTMSATSNGWYYRASQWRRPAERGLVGDSVASQLAIATSTWPWWTPTTSQMPLIPDVAKFTLDFNRHSSTGKGTSVSTASINMLYCDGHVSVVSAREAFRAIRFK
ncbi:MAG TPA: prepilin-type N-terminal cleavage/methylation domain-containing protein [Roseimicrobium sp.]|nr:prepilin-type N-terminal cleavage/methylation domain-containing protein [Roseimicrobium sp.]